MLKGYYTPSVYMGWIGKEWMPFASERDYIEYMEDYIVLYFFA